VTRFTRLHSGAQKGGATNLGSLFEPRHEQNLYANPKRTAKSFIRYICIDAVRMQMVQKKNKYFLARLFNQWKVAEKIFVRVLN
jgi:hypothetical protein